MLAKSTLQFLSRLKKNNHKPWFDLHRSDYEAAKADFEKFVGQLIAKHATKDPALQSLKAKDCLFRINRDVRFSKDKSPYKTNFGASITAGGKKSGRAGYYIHCEPGDSFVGGGIWMPDPASLKKLRQEIDYGFPEFEKIISSKKFRSVYGGLYEGGDIALVKVPQGFEKDHPGARFLKLKSYIAMKPLSDADLQSKKLLSTAAEAFAALQPLVAFLNHGLSE